MQRLSTLVPGHLSSHFALPSYGLFARLALWQLSVSVRPLVQNLGDFSASGAPWSPAMPPSLGRGRVNSSNNNNRTNILCLPASFSPVHLNPLNSQLHNFISAVLIFLHELLLESLKQSMEGKKKS